MLKEFKDKVKTIIAEHEQAFKKLGDELLEQLNVELVKVPNLKNLIVMDIPQPLMTVIHVSTAPTLR